MFYLVMYVFQPVGSKELSGDLGKTVLFLFIKNSRRGLVQSCPTNQPTNDYELDGGLGEVWLLCSSYHDSLQL